MLTVPQKVFNHPLSGILLIAHFRSGLSRFTASPGSWVNDMVLGITITAPTSSGLVQTEEPEAYGSLLQLVILCEHGSKLEAYKWEELSITLSDVMHPLAVDVLSAEDIGEDAEASLQARIPSATVHLHTITDKRWALDNVVKKFWEQMDSANASASPAGS